MQNKVQCQINENCNSHIHTSEDFPNGARLDDKMDIFVARLHGGQTEIANALIANNVSLRGFALLHIVISMFKINGKYRSGYQGERYSRKYFKENVKHVFKQDIEDENAPLFNALMNTSEVESTMSG